YHHHEHHECSCGHDHHEHHEGCSCGHDHHHADEAFTSWGFETVKHYTEEDIRNILTALDSGEYGHILRAKGMVNGTDGWIYFDYVPEEHEIRGGAPCYTGKICVIGAELMEDKLSQLLNK
ncbi:MAG: cobalamin biosynthesis protein CobW, partial [Clostridia bacterium]|nr:cobalamin biosynthesis protein CobW [Clostridia bacterium]